MLECTRLAKVNSPRLPVDMCTRALRPLGPCFASVQDSDSGFSVCMLREVKERGENQRGERRREEERGGERRREEARAGERR